MYYKGKEMNAREHYETKMAEVGFDNPYILVGGWDVGEEPQVNGLYYSEAQYYTLAEYLSSCDTDAEFEELLKELGYTLEDFDWTPQEDYLITKSGVCFEI